MDEIHFAAYHCCCKSTWGSLFPVTEQGDVDGSLLVKLKEGGDTFLLDILFRDELQLQFELTLSAGDVGDTTKVYKTDLLYAHPSWVVKSFEIHAVIVRETERRGDLSLTFINTGYDRLFGLEVTPQGLTAEPPTKEDAIH